MQKQREWVDVPGWCRVAQIYSEIISIDDPFGEECEWKGEKKQENQPGASESIETKTLKTLSKLNYHLIKELVHDHYLA